MESKTITITITLKNGKNLTITNSYNQLLPETLLEQFGQDFQYDLLEASFSRIIEMMKLNKIELKDLKSIHFEV